MSDQPLKWLFPPLRGHPSSGAVSKGGEYQNYGQLKLKIKIYQKEKCGGG